jgi:hypothetical protein
MRLARTWEDGRAPSWNEQVKSLLKSSYVTTGSA